MKKFAIHATAFSIFFVVQSNAAITKKKAVSKAASSSTIAVANKEVASKLPKKVEGAMVASAENVATTTAVLPKDETKSSLGATLIVKSNTPMSDTRSSELEGFVGPTYKIDKNNSVGFRHYFMGRFETSQIESEDKSNHLTLRNSIESLTYTHGSESGFLGSQPVVSTFFINAPGGDKTLASKKYRFGLRYDARPSWQLTPKLSASYFFSPRYSKYEENDFEGSHIQDTLKVIHYAEMDYSMTDTVVFYGTAGYTNIFQAQNLVYTDETAMLAAGVNFVLGNGKFILNPELDKEVSVIKGQERQASANLFTPDNLTMVLAGAMTF